MEKSAVVERVAREFPEIGTDQLFASCDLCGTEGLNSYNDLPEEFARECGLRWVDLEVTSFASGETTRERICECCEKGGDPEDPDATTIEEVADDLLLFFEQAAVEELETSLLLPHDLLMRWTDGGPAFLVEIARSGKHAPIKFAADPSPNLPYGTPENEDQARFFLQAIVERAILENEIPGEVAKSGEAPNAVLLRYPDGSVFTITVRRDD